MQYKYNFQVGEIFMTPNISKHTLQRLPMYLSYIQGLPEDAPKNISATTIAEALQLNDVQVRKDLASVSSSGKPKVGYNVKDLIAELEAFLGYNDIDNAVIVGAGSLGKALLNYSGFKAYGLNIIAAFDLCEEPTGLPDSPARQLLPQGECAYRHHHCPCIERAGDMRPAC